MTFNYFQNQCIGGICESPKQRDRRCIALQTCLVTDGIAEGNAPESKPIFYWLFQFEECLYRTLTCAFCHDSALQEEGTSGGHKGKG